LPSVVVSGSVAAVGGTSSIEVYFTLTRDRSAAAQIDWDKVNGNGLRTLCTYSLELKGLPGS
jgi:hypothetical protein